MSAALIQRARDIVADTFLEAKVATGKKPTSFATIELWLKHSSDYARFMREGAYDDDIAVQATLTALKQVAP